MLRTIHRAAVMREAVVAGLVATLTFAPTGCINITGGTGDDNPDDLKTATGLFINDNPADGWLAGGRAPDGSTFFIFGSRTSSGELRELDAITVRDPNGNEAFIDFDQGRPTHIEGLDGSYAHITYTETSSERLAGSVEIFNAADRSVQTFPVDIDLRRAADEIAREVSDRTGKQLSAAALRLPLAAGADKSADAAQVTIRFDLGLAAGLFFVSIGAAFQLLITALGQVLTFVFAAVGTVLRNVLLIIFYPLYAIAELFEGASDRPRETDLTITFGFIPVPPIVVLQD